MSYYQRLKDLRNDADLTQKQIAEKLFDSQQHYQLYECGKIEPPFEMIVRLAKIYGVSIDYIAGITTEKRGMYTGKERKLIKKYEKLSSENKARIDERMNVLIEKQKEE